MLSLALSHQLVASGYFGPFDYPLTHFVRGLNDNPFFNTLFFWITFAGDLLFSMLILGPLYLAGYRKEALVTALALLATYASPMVSSFLSRARGRLIWEWWHC